MLVPEVDMLGMSTAHQLLDAKEKARRRQAEGIVEEAYKPVERKVAVAGIGIAMVLRSCQDVELCLGLAMCSMVVRR